MDRHRDRQGLVLALPAVYLGLVQVSHRRTAVRMDRHLARQASALECLALARGTRLRLVDRTDRRLVRRALALALMALEPKALASKLAQECSALGRLAVRQMDLPCRLEASVLAALG